jgi:hypothetical protein
MEEIAFIFNDCCTDDGDEDGLDEHSEHHILEERPYLPKRKHSIITLQTTTVVRLPTVEHLSSIAVTETINDNESNIKKDEISDFVSEDQSSPLPREVLENGLSTCHYLVRTNTRTE